MTETRRFGNERGAVTAARRFAVQTLSEVAPEFEDTVEVLVSELASNCVRHTDTAFELTITHSAGEIRVAATDWGAGEPVMRAPAPLATSGRGLPIIDMMANRGGWSRLRRLGPARPSGSRCVSARHRRPRYSAGSRPVGFGVRREVCH